LVVFVEGKGDEDAAQSLLSKLLTLENAWDCVFLDSRAFRVGNLHGLTRKHSEKWLRHLRAAHASRPNLGAVLLVLDGDLDSWRAADGASRQFCVVDAAKHLAQIAYQGGIHKLFSLGIVFARQEFESWIIAGLAPDSAELKPATELPQAPEESPRDAKRWLARHVHEGYRPTEDQGRLAGLIDVESAASKSRSFQRLRSAVKQLTAAIRAGRPVITPLAADVPG
jgi:hypothetical protein